MDICFTPVSPRRCLLHKLFIIITLSVSGNHQNHFDRLCAANGQLLVQTFKDLDCNIPLNKYAVPSGQQSNTLAEAGSNSQPSIYESCAVLLFHTCPLNDSGHFTTPLHICWKLFICIYLSQNARPCFIKP